MNAIVAISKNWGIGYQGNLLIRIPEDMKRFREMTTQKIVVMGRKTFESLPHALPDRVNIVITSNPDYSAESIEVCADLDAVFKLLESKYYQQGYTSDDVFIIGGERVYREFIPYCKKAYVTLVYKDFDAIDTYFPDLSSDRNWESADVSLMNTSEKDQVQFRYLEFENSQVK